MYYYLNNKKRFFFQSLESQEFDRAGVKQRVYKNSVYKIRDPDNENQPYTYVVAEGATPLKTLYDVRKNPKMSGKREVN